MDKRLKMLLLILGVALVLAPNCRGACSRLAKSLVKAGL